MMYRMVSFPMTSNDPVTRVTFQKRCILSYSLSYRVRTTLKNLEIFRNLF